MLRRGGGWSTVCEPGLSGRLDEYGEHSQLFLRVTLEIVSQQEDEFYSRRVNRPPIEPERATEMRARALLERVLGCRFERVPQSDVPTVDYRSVDEPPRSVEVKEITSHEYRDLTDAYDANQSFDSTLLTGRWLVAIEAPSLSQKLQPMPDFPADDSQLISGFAAIGSVMLRADREDEWRNQHPVLRQPTVRLKHLARDIEQALRIVEADGIVNTRGAMPSCVEVTRALAEIQSRTAGAIGMRFSPSDGQSPGIDLALASGGTRTERADTMATRVQLWLDSDLSLNLRRSLANEIDTERHAVLVFDPRTEPEHQAAVEQGLSFLPTTALELPSEVDALWFILGPLACGYMATVGWQAFAMPELDAWCSSTASG